MYVSSRWGGSSHDCARTCARTLLHVPATCGQSRRPTFIVSRGCWSRSHHNFRFSGRTAHRRPLRLLVSSPTLSPPLVSYYQANCAVTYFHTRQRRHSDQATPQLLPEAAITVLSGPSLNQFVIIRTVFLASRGLYF